LSLATSAVRADTVTATLENPPFVSGTAVNDGAGGQGGVFNWSGATYNPNPAFATLGNFYSAPGGTSFQTFCFDATTAIAPGNTPTYTLTTSLGSSLITQELKSLFALEFYNPTQGLIQTTATGYAALQLAIWTILYGNGSLDVYTTTVPNGTETLADANSGNPAVAEAQTFLNTVSANPNGYDGYLADYLVALTGSSSQGQIGINTGGGSSPSTVVPVPGGLVLALTGVLSLLCSGLIRKPARA
jgi:hypothetical protein